VIVTDKKVLHNKENEKNKTSFIKNKHKKSIKKIKINLLGIILFFKSK
jgi:hypothetical protein